MVFGCFVCNHLPKAKALIYFQCVTEFPFARLLLVPQSCTTARDKSKETEDRLYAHDSTVECTPSHVGYRVTPHTVMSRLDFHLNLQKVTISAHEASFSR